MNHQFLFVYGTLKRGFVRHLILQNESYHCSAATVDGHRLFDCGSYPGLVPSSSGLAIQGEVYLVSDECLAVCDEVEGVADGLYVRERIAVQPIARSEDPLTVWAYLFLGTTDGLPDCGKAWPQVD